MDIGIAAVVAVLFTALVVVIEVSRAAKSSLNATIRGPTILYFLITSVGNVFTTFLAAATTANKVPDAGPSWFWFAILGVFGFQALLKHINLTFSDIGVLTINDWITKAKDGATADVIEAEVNSKEAAALKLALRLATLADDVLNAHVLNILGSGQVTLFDQAAANENADAKLVKALALAKGNYVRALAISPA